MRLHSRPCSNCRHRHTIIESRFFEGKTFQENNHHTPITILKLALFFFLLLSLGFADAPLAEPLAPEEKDDILIIGVRQDAPPFSSFEPNADPKTAKGYSVDLCKLIALDAVEEGLYKGYKFKTVTADNRFKLLKNKKIHLLCGASTVTLERMRVADFSLFTFLSGSSVMHNESNIKEKENKKEPVTVGVLGKTTSQDKAKEFFLDHQQRNNNFGFSTPPTVETTTVDNHFKALKLLKEGTIDAYVADREILLSLNQKNIQDKGENMDLVVSENYYSIEPYAIGIVLDNPELRYCVNRVLSQLYDWEQGGYKGIHIFRLLWNNFPRKKFSPTLETLFRFQRIPQGRPIDEEDQKNSPKISNTAETGN